MSRFQVIEIYTNQRLGCKTSGQDLLSGARTTWYFRGAIKGIREDRALAEETDLAERLRKLQEHAERLEDQQRQLERDLEEVEHQSRRLSERTERGERSADLEEASRRLDERRELNLRGQRDNTRELETLREQREELEQWLREMRGETGGSSSS